MTKPPTATALEVRSNPQQPTGAELMRPAWDDEALQLVKQQICKPRNRLATDGELALFAHECARSGLDPFAGEIFAVFRWNGATRREEMSIQTGIDGFRKRANDTGEYRGQAGPQWCGPDGQWKDVWLADEPPAAARVGVLKQGFTEPLWGLAKWSEYVQKKQDGKPEFMWQRMPAHMLAKCAEALALRKAFPRTLAGLHIPEEMAQALNPDTPLEEEPPPRPHAAPTARVPAGAEAKGRKPEKSEPLITAAQRRKLWKEAEKAGIKSNEPLLRAVIRWAGGSEHTDRIPRSKVNDVYKAIADHEGTVAAIHDAAADGDQLAQDLVHRFFDGGERIQDAEVVEDDGQPQGELL